MKDKKRRAGIRFTNDIYINFIYDPESNTVEVYKNGELITSGQGVTLEELMQILEAYVTKEELETALDPYLTEMDLETALANYVTNSNLATILGSYVTVTAFNTALADYVTRQELGTYITAEDLNSALAPYVTSTDLNTTLNDYVSDQELSTTLADYVTNTTLADYVTNEDLNTTLGDYAEKSDLPIFDSGNGGGQVPAGSYADFPVTFNVTFTNNPVVFPVIYSTSTSGDIGSLTVSAINITTTGFTLRIFNNSSNQRTPATRWLAVQY